MLYALYHSEATDHAVADGALSLGDTFQYTIERKRHYMGAWHTVMATIFPNFLFLDCEKDEAKKLQEKGLPLVPVPDELSTLLTDLSDEKHYISMSRGIIRDGVAHVTEGPLIGHDNRIVRIDRHKRLAWLKVSEAASRDFSKDSTSVLVAGLEIMEKIDNPLREKDREESGNRG